MATEIQRILIKYEADIKDLSAKLTEVQKEMAQTGAKGSASVGTVGKSVSGLGGIVKTLGPIFATAFSAKVLLDFGKGMFELQKQAQTIRASFNTAFKDPTYLDDLRKATEGTISDLELMKLALRAKEFNIPRDVFASGLQFASIQADKLGKSSEELREKLVDAFGSRNVRALKDLGISTDELNAKVRETGDFYKAVGAIIEETIGENTATKIETLADRQDKLNATLANLGVRISDSLLPVFEVLVGALESAVNGVENLQSVLKVGFVVTDEKAAQISEAAKAETEALVNFYNGLIASGQLTQEQASAAIIKRIKIVEEEIEKSGNKVSSIGRAVATSLNAQTGGALFGSIVEDTRAAGDAVNSLLPTLEALKETYAKLNEEADGTEKVFDLQTATISELQAELQRLNTIISGQSDRGIISGLQATQTKVKARLDFLLATTKKGGDKLAITQAELAAKFLEEFDLSAEIDRIGLSTESAIERFYRERLEQLAGFKKEIAAQAAEINRSGRTEEEQGDFDALGMTPEEFLAQTREISGTYDDFIQQINDANLSLAIGAADAGLAVFAAISQATGAGAELATAVLLFEKFIAIAEIGINLQKEIALIGANPTLSLLPDGGLAIKSALITQAKVRAAIGAASVAATAIPQFAFEKGTSFGPGEDAIVGERGPERMFVPKGARIFTAEASKKERSLIDALNAGKHDEFIHDHYLKPFAAQLAQGNEGWSYDDFQLRQAVRGNKVVKIHPESLRKMQGKTINRYR